jgi:type I restriction enzyme S subunit
LTQQAVIWREQLKRKLHLASILASATIAIFTGIVTEQTEESMKVPQTELIATLRLGIVPDIKAHAPLATILTRHNGEMPAKDLWQRFGGEIDAFYAQLKTEVAHGWIDDPTYDLEDKNPKNPKSYPDGAYVAKMIMKEHA